jgi:exodeoxyribonuclease III
MTLKIASWNVNSIKARLPHLLKWLPEAAPDIVLLQETKVVDEAFPALEIHGLGYNVVMAGQRGYNGVAILSKYPIEVSRRALPEWPEWDDPDTHARYIEALTGGLQVASIYLPNGNPIGTDKFTYKLSWMARLHRHVQALLEAECAFVLAGDYNVAPDDRDVYDPEAFSDDAICQPASRAAFRKIIHLGVTDAVRTLSEEHGLYTYWDYQRGALRSDHGIRIDHLLLSPQAADRLQEAGIDKAPRFWDKPSDHTPVWCTLTSNAR